MTAMAHLKLLLLLLWVGVSVSMVLDLHKRIIGGQECQRTERMYHVKLNLDGKFACGGSLIHKQWVLTATHCWNDGGHLTAVLGLHPRGGQAQAAQIARRVPYFENNIIHDIMLLKLSAPSNIAPGNLPDCKKRPQKNEKVQIAGYAATTMGPNNERVCGESNTLQCADTNVVDCPAHNRPGHLFCGQRPGVDACHGDSGGGVVYNNKIYGVISFTCNGTHACTAPLGFMDVCAYKDWIDNTIATNI